MRRNGFLKRGKSYRLLLTSHLHLEAFLLLDTPPPLPQSSKGLVTNQPVIKTWRPEIKHLFVFHVQISTQFSLSYTLSLLPRVDSFKPVTAGSGAGQLPTQHLLTARLLLEMVSALEELVSP